MGAAESDSSNRSPKFGPAPLALLPSQKSATKSTLTSLPVEILEAILLHLPALDLLLAQRVCRTFRAVILSSKRILRALFLDPAHQSGDTGLWEMLKWNPFLHNRLSRLLNTRVIGVRRSADGSVKMMAHVRFRGDVVLDPYWINVFLYDHASWRRMLVTQPPATLLLHPSASLFWKTDAENRAQFSRHAKGVTIEGMVSRDVMD
ncbi:hypothetical protein CC78DRAFT_544135 [Lojkania enalia]|uniref:F-box domain-containing protein n=1 Tax=Lojkania enalia TaxID=147567 RepID=A0A9P4K9M4_9PLEO|nr:hypothetical protein CC78DRAFT_544135 [Didymosphaeria enalia]